ncbi:MAG: TonB-dependent receptor domain-containing protein [Tenacibaculum sp.]
MKKIVFVAFISLCNLVFSQDSGIVTGVVTDKEMNGEPLPFANVFVKGTSIGGITDIDGKYSIKVPVGKQVIVFSFVGYREVEKEVEVKKGVTLNLDQALGASEGLKLEEIKINAAVSKEKESALLLEQKKANIIKESIGAEELAKKGVGDAAVAVSKISGVSKEESSSNVYVRGLGDRYLNTTLNGLTLPSNDINNKNISLSLFPSDIIKNISISKAYSSEFYSDFSAGNINIDAKQHKGKSYVEVEIGGLVNSRAAGIDNFRKTEGSGAFGFYSRYEHNPYAIILSHGFETKGTYTPINTNFGINAGKTYKFNNDESSISIFGTASFSNNYEYREGPVVNFTSIFDTNFPNAQEYFYSTQSTVMLNALYKINSKNKLNYTSLFLNSSTDQVGFYGVKGEGFNRDATIGAFYQQNIQFNQDLVFVNQITGQHKFDGKDRDNEFEIDWGIGYNNVFAHEPDRKRVSMQNYQFALDNDPATNPIFFTNNPYDNQRYFQKIIDEELNSRVNISYKPNDKLKFNIGYNGRIKLRNFENQRFGYNFNSGFELTPITDVNNLNLIFNLDNTQFFKSETDKLFRIETIKLLPGFEDSNLLSLPGPNENTYEGNLKIQAGYISAEIQVGEKLSLVPGIRLENFNQSISWDVINLNENRIGEVQAKENFFLPSFNLKYSLNTDMNLRFNFSKTVSVPEFKEVAIFVYESVSEQIGGNPDLLSNPSFSEIYNFDLKYEWFMERNELLSLATFIKQIKNPINRVIANDATGNQRYFRTGNMAEVYGVELELRKNIIKNTDDQNQLSAGLNMTYMYTNQDLKSSQGIFSTSFNRTSDKLQGASDLLVNANINYSPTQFENYKPIASLVGSYFSDRIAALGSGNLGNIVEKSVLILDLIWKNKVGRNWELNLSAKNLLDPYIRRVRENTSFGEVELYSYKRGITAGFNIKYKF